VADAAVLFYRTATPSGIESLSYNFKLPLIATAVGHFPETIQNGFNGYLAIPGDVDDMAQQMLNAMNRPIDRKNVEEATKNMSWENYARVITRH
jgi:glycosyltransferase involved in cell wall biosynthesis